MLILLPNLLSADASVERSFPKELHDVVSTLDGVIAENEKEARRFLKLFATLKKPLQETPITVLNEHTKESELPALLEPLIRRETWGLLSDAGLPAVADPGAPLVRLAYAHNIPVRAVVGPSSIIMALQLSGCCTQQFTFHGYLPQDVLERKAAIRALAKQREQGSHIVIETPYRNEKMLADLIECLPPHFRLAIASGLMSQNEKVISLRVTAWRSRARPVLDRVPTVFVFCPE